MKAGCQHEAQKLKLQHSVFNRGTQRAPELTDTEMQAEAAEVSDL